MSSQSGQILRGASCVANITANSMLTATLPPIRLEYTKAGKFLHIASLSLVQPSCQQVMSTVANHRFISTKVGVSASHYMHITHFSHQQAEGMEVELLQANRPSV